MAIRDEPATATPRLRSGRNAMPRARVRVMQRRRILAAAVDTVGDVGYARMTVAQVIARARVSRKTFYDIFADREECFRAAFEQALSEATVLATRAYGHQSSWRAGIRAALARLLMFMDEEPVLARLLVVESLAAGTTVLGRRSEVLAELSEIVDRGRSVADGAREPARLTAEGVVGGVCALLYTRLLQERGEPLEDLLGALMSMIVLPYLGARAASRELVRPPPPIRGARAARRPAARDEELEGLKIRLTYRTVQVLTVIADRPGATNREVAEGSDVVDQGQISKLLARLAALGLIENFGRGKEGGAANAWRLTELGAQLERTTRLPDPNGPI
jgi:AcrR family transcriptional regulator